MPQRLSDTQRAKLDDIVQRMAANGESDDDIQFVVNDFKTKYAAPEREQETGASLAPSVASVATTR